MKTALTPSLFRFLIEQGYQYLLSKTDNINVADASVRITLTPVVEKPVLQKLPRDFDMYFRITREPKIMSKGIDDTLVQVNLSDSDVAKLKEIVLRTDSRKELYA